MSDPKITPESIRAIAISQRLTEIREKVLGILGDDAIPALREYRPTIREGCKRLKLDPVGVASIMGQQILAENGNPLPFIAACVQYVLDGQPID